MAESSTYPARHIVELLGRTAEKFRDRPAIQFGGGTVRYGELDERVTRLASLLCAEGIGPGDICGIYASPCVDAVVAILAVVRTGAAFLPMCPSLPTGRLSTIVAHARPKLVLSADPSAPPLAGGAPLLHVAEAAERPAGLVAPATPSPIDPENSVSVMFTSGSTGVPKGVMIPHRALLNRVLWGQREYPLGPEDRVLHHTRYIYDFSAWEVFASLAFGATLVIGDFQSYPDFDAMAEVIQKNEVTAVHFVPSVLSGFLARTGAHACVSLTTAFSGGESLPTSVALRLTETCDAVLFNQYGPTETCIDSTCFRFQADGPLSDQVPIGREIDGTRLYLLDSDLRPVPDGDTGELHIAGAGLAIGYLNRPDLTAERFVPDPFAGGGQRMYRSGDLVRRRADGQLEFVGRVDRQVNLRGVRIELAEVEAALTTHTAVAQAVALVVDDERPRLVAWVVATPGGVDGGTLREFLQNRLPRPFVPDRICLGDRVPLLPTGKVDHNKVRDLVAAEVVHADTASTEDAAQAVGDVLDAVIALWQEVLGVDHVGPDDDFFELGGHSLLAVELVSVLNERLGCAVGLADFFESPRARTCAAIVRPGGGE